MQWDRAFLFGNVKPFITNIWKAHISHWQPGACRDEGAWLWCSVGGAARRTRMEDARCFDDKDWTVLSLLTGGAMFPPHSILQQVSWCLFVRCHLMSQCLHCWHILWNRCSVHLPALCATCTALLEDCFPNPSSDGKGQAVLLLLFLLLLICLETLLAQNLAQLLMKKGRSAHVKRASRVLKYRLDAFEA